MSNVQEVMDYIMNTPHNTNPMILKQKLEGLDNGGNGGGKDKSLYGLPYRCNLIFAGEFQPKQDEDDNWIVDQEVEFSGEFTTNQMFIVFIGEKINDNKYGTIITQSYGDYNDESEEWEICLNLDEQYNSWDALTSGSIYFITSYNQPIKIKGYLGNENPFYLTVYRVAGYGEEYQFDIQLEDFIDSSLLPIPTIFTQKERCSLTSRSCEQIEEQLNMLKCWPVLIMENGSYLNSIGYDDRHFKFLTFDSTDIYVMVNQENEIYIRDHIGE